MRGRYPCGGLHRREFAATALSMIGAATAAAQEPKAGARPAAPTGALGVPGPYPGRVIEVRNPGMLQNGKKDRVSIRMTLNRGITALTGTNHPVEAWKTFVQPGEAVGIKVVPNGYPGAHTSHELVLDVIAGLRSAGINLKDIVVFDRYGLEFREARYQEILPAGVACGGLTPVAWDPGQLTIKFDTNDPIAGYDPDEYVQLTLVGRGQDPKDDRCFRSHLGRIVTKRLDKIILLPCLKDHHAAGATGALKNMSHGLVNNVFRSHSSPSSIAMVSFIPAVVSHPIIRQKCVLHIMDGIRGVWEGGPFGREPKWLFDYNAPACSRPTRWRWTTSSGTSSTPSARRWACRASVPSAASPPTRSSRRVTTSGSRSTSRWRARWGWGTSTTSRRPVGGSRSITASSTSPDQGPGI